jgi:hypothetical protein
MSLRNLLTLSTLITSALSTSSIQVPITDSLSSRGPDTQYAKENAIKVFNALHASMRQWDSSLKHNGMSFFAASIPNNTLLYHGTHTDKAVEGIEWLAFEIEHAEVFARTRGPGGGPGRGPPGGGPPGDGDRGRGPPGDGAGPPRDGQSGSGPRAHMNNMAVEGDGYLHIYKTKRPLTKLLYLDGMSAGKTSMGTLDTQDRVFLNSTSGPDTATAPPGHSGPFGDYVRAETMCALGAEYGIEGIIRMEAGFELILCNFSTGVELVSAFQRPQGDNELGQFEYMRGVAYRYDGITARRVVVDYSSMVSAFFYPLNLTNPDPTRPELPRLPADDLLGLARLKSDVLDLLSAEKAQSTVTVDWQGVVDMIVTRYADRLQYMALNTSTKKTLLSEVTTLLTIFMDYKDPSPSIMAAMQACTDHYLLPVSPSTPSDHLIYTSVSTVSNKICKTLFSVRSRLISTGNDDDQSALKEMQDEIKDLITYLDWSTWKSCGKCAYDEICFVAIWPWGGIEDHMNPGCVKNEMLPGRRGYWDFSG